MDQCRESYHQMVRHTIIGRSESIGFGQLTININICPPHTRAPWPPVVRTTRPHSTKNTQCECCEHASRGGGSAIPNMVPSDHDVHNTCSDNTCIFEIIGVWSGSAKHTQATSHSKSEALHPNLLVQQHNNVLLFGPTTIHTRIFHEICVRSQQTYFDGQPLSRNRCDRHTESAPADLTSDLHKNNNTEHKKHPDCNKVCVIFCTTRCGVTQDISNRGRTRLNLELQNGVTHPCSYTGLTLI